MITRRSFVVGGVKVAAALPALSLLARARRASDGERVLVVLQLTGGNDGLNTVVPHRQDAYFRLRPTLGLARAALHRLDDDHGLHPSMRELGALFADGRVALVHGVGYPDPSRSHFRSMEIWHTGEPDKPAGDVGWLGRIADQLAEHDPTSIFSMHVGSGDLPLMLRGIKFFAPSVESAEQFRLRELTPSVARARDALLASRSASTDLGFLRDAARTTYRVAARMSELAERATPVTYPNSDLARHLHLVARLIAGGFGTRLFHVELGGFDTHARQAPTQAALLAELSSSLAAFDADLRANGADERVVTLVFSEFGRRTEENGSKGTDHGAAAPVFLVGPRVKPGCHGTAPDLEKLVDGDVPSSTDFRDVLALVEGSTLQRAAPPRAGALRLFG